MGAFHTDCKIENHVDRQRKAEVENLLVDTGSEYTWIAKATFDSIGVAREKKLVASGPYPAA